jgi:hypothetical protein
VDTIDFPLVAALSFIFDCLLIPSIQKLLLTWSMPSKIPIINLSDLMNHHADKLCELESEDSDTEIDLAPAYSHTHETQAPVRVRKLDLNATLMDFAKLTAQQVFVRNI